MIDLRDPLFRKDPDRFLAARRDEASSHVDPFGTVVVLGHAEVARLLRDPRLGKDLRHWRGYGLIRPYGAGTTFERYVESWMLSRDGVDHARLRRLTAHVFTPRAVAHMRATVEACAASLIDGISPRGPVELMKAFAEPYPVLVISRILGFPASDIQDLKRWSDGLAVAVELMPKKYPEADEAARAMAQYVLAHVEARRRRPSDDLLTMLVEARDQQDRGDSLSEDELVAMVLLLFVAAHETTTNLLGVGLMELLRQPDELSRLRAHPELMPSAIEELARISTPGPFSGRAALAPLVLDDNAVPAGGLVLLSLSAANRDPRVFQDADRLDLGRNPNPHVAFGGGAHFCLGAPLARMEAAIALEHILRRWPSIALDGEPRWLPRTGLRGLQSLPLHVGAEGGAEHLAPT